MKRFLLVLVISAFFAAQHATAQPIAFGMKAGLTFSKVSDKSLDGAHGFQGGVVLKINPPGVGAVQAEAIFTQKGFAATESIVGGRSELLYRLNYVEFPLLMVLEAPVKGKAYPRLFFGPAPSFILSSTLEINGKSVEINNDGLNQKDVGLILGAGVGFTLKGADLLFDFRYTKGVNQVFKDEPGNNGAYSLGLALIH